MIYWEKAGILNLNRVKQKNCEQGKSLHQAVRRRREDPIAASSDHSGLQGRCNPILSPTEIRVRGLFTK